MRFHIILLFLLLLIPGLLQLLLIGLLLLLLGVHLPLRLLLLGLFLLHFIIYLLTVHLWAFPLPPGVPVRFFSISLLTSPGYKMVELALGKADLYLHAGGARRWDLCGPTAILQARGGVISRMSDGRGAFTFQHHDDDSIDASGGIFAAASRSLFDKWKPTVAKLYASLPASK